jgi:hypothetical protein
MRALGQKVFTVLAVFGSVAGWVLLSNPPRSHDRAGAIYLDFTRPEIYIGVFLLSAGISYFAIRVLERSVNSS